MSCRRADGRLPPTVAPGSGLCGTRSASLNYGRLPDRPAVLPRDEAANDPVRRHDLLRLQTSLIEGAVCSAYRPDGEREHGRSAAMMRRS